MFTFMNFVSALLKFKFIFTQPFSIFHMVCGLIARGLNSTEDRLPKGKLAKRTH